MKVQIQYGGEKMIHYQFMMKLNESNLHVEVSTAAIFNYVVQQ